MLLLGVLQAQAAGAGPVVDSDFDLIEQQVLLSTETSIVFDNLDTIAAGYQHLQIRVAARGTSANNARPVILNFNGDTTASYSSHDLFGTGSSVLSSADTSANYSFFGQITSGSNTANAFGAIVSDILDPFNTSKNTTFRSLSGHSASDPIILMSSGAFYKTEAITSITLAPFTDSFAIGSRFSLYGLKASV